MIYSSIIPPEYYTLIFYTIVLGLLIFDLISLIKKGYVIKNSKRIDYKSVFLLLLVVFYMGLRPISGKYFGDMATYNHYFEQYASGADITTGSDILWQIFMKFCSGIMSAKMFFLVCSMLYVYPLYKASKNWLGANNYFLFLMFIASFSFWAYGTNGIRNGIATSLFVLGISYNHRRILKFGLITLSFFIHASLIIPIAGFIFTTFYQNSKYYFFFWCICILFSLSFGEVFETLFASIGFEDPRLSYLTEGNVNNDDFAYIGFRFDFLLYSASAIFAGYYFVIKKKFKDKTYIQLLNIYILSNAFWVLVIRANFSNRFAYLSWFLMAAVIFYPFFKGRFFNKQHTTLVYTIFSYFGFSYLMFLLL